MNVESVPRSWNCPKCLWMVMTLPSTSHVSCPRCEYRGPASETGGVEVETVLIGEDQDGNMVHGPRRGVGAATDNGAALGPADTLLDRALQQQQRRLTEARRLERRSLFPADQHFQVDERALLPRIASKLLRLAVSVCLMASLARIRNLLWPSLLVDLPNLTELENLVVKSPEEMSAWFDSQGDGVQTDMFLLFFAIFLVNVIAELFSKSALDLYVMDVRTLCIASRTRQVFRAAVSTLFFPLHLPLDFLSACITEHGQSLTDLVCGTQVVRPQGQVALQVARERHLGFVFMLSVALAALSGAQLLYTGDWKSRPAELGRELIENGEFSDSLNGWKPVVYRGRTTDVSVVRDGGANAALRLYQYLPGDKETGDWAAVAQNVGHRLRTGRFYEFAVRYRQVPADGHTPIRVGFRFTDPTLVQSATPITEASWNVDTMRADGRWHQIRFRFQARPEFIKTMPMLWLGLDYFAGKGEVFLDSVSLREVL